MSVALTARSGDNGLQDDGLGHDGRHDDDGCANEEDDDGDRQSPTQTLFYLWKDCLVSGRRQTSTTGRRSRRTWPFKTASETPSAGPPGSASTMEEGSDGGRSVALLTSVGSSLYNCVCAYFFFA